MKENKAKLITRGKQVCKGKLKKMVNGNRKREIGTIIKKKERKDRKNKIGDEEEEGEDRSTGKRGERGRKGKNHG